MREEPDFFLINEDELDREWVEQPRLYFRYAKKLALARRDLEQAKTNLEVVAADLSKKIRKDPGRFGIEKITDKTVESAVVTSKEYQQAQTTVTDAGYQVNLLVAAVSTLDHRKRALENLVDLHGMNYFSAPKARTNSGREAADDIRKRRARRAYDGGDEDG